ncbi:unnamed protein product [Paramecium primaurelia]|uniref:Transmembrane protein n=1 Tax=Paramecium primaurelia TaxID=5886 RepID=A0A8S1KY00_PARPR|nr:unnamed protein product [Paramecium primaurelia]
MFHYLSKIDNFGAEFKPRITNSEHEHKSIIGGVFTLLVYGVCLAYFIFVLQQWQTGQILPKILIESSVAAFSKFMMPNDLIAISYIRYEDQDIDPFSEQGNILMPMVAVLENNKPISYRSILNNNELSDYGTNLVEMEQMELVKNMRNDKSQENNKVYMLLITTCKQQYLKHNQTCASESEISNFLNLGLIPIEITVTLQQFSTSDQQLYEVEKRLQFLLQDNLALKADLLFQNTKSIIDDHPLFSNQKRFVYFSDFTVLTQTLSNNLSKSIIQDDVFIQIAFKIDPIETVQQITYVKIGEMLAEVGSIANLLLTVSWFIQQFNKEELENKIIDEIISVYYPQFKQIKKIKNCMGRTIELRHEKEKINQKEFNKWYNKVRQNVIIKLSIVNQIHEISRLYFILRSQANFQSMIRFQDYGIQLPNKLFEKQKDEINNELPSRDFKIEDYDIESSKIITNNLCDEDLNILSYRLNKDK